MIAMQYHHSVMMADFLFHVWNQIDCIYNVHVYVVSVFPHPLILNFMLKNTVL